MKHEYTEQERTAVALSRSLRSVMFNAAFEKTFDEKSCELQEESADYIGYNAAYYDGSWHNPEVDADFYFKVVERIGDAFVIRLVDYHLPDALHPLCDNNRTDLCELQERADDGDEEAIAEVERISDEFWDSIADKTYVKEVAQLHFMADGSVVPLQLRGKSFRPARLEDIIEMLGWDGWDATGTVTFDLADMTPCKAMDAMHKFLQETIRDIKDSGYDLLLRSTDQRTHTLRRWGYDWLANTYLDGNLNVVRFYQQFKVGHRNGMVADTAERQQQWLQLLEIVADCNGNLQDPRNFMPEDLDAAFAAWKARNDRRLFRLNQERERAAREEAERRALAEAQRLAAAEKDYKARRGAYLGIKADDGHLELSLLQNVQEFALEGLLQGHCVYSNKYYEMPDYLVFKCLDKDTGAHISTVTYDIKRREVVANLGRLNSVPPQAEHICDMMRSLSDEIETVAARQTETAVSKTALLEQRRERELYRRLANGVA